MANFAVTVLLTEFFVVVLPTVLYAYSYHGYDTYREFYRSRIDEKYLKPSTSTSATETRLRFHNNNAMREAVPRLRIPYENMGLGNNIVFPDEVRMQMRTDDDNTEDKIGSVPICEGQTFCEDTPNYPKELVDQELARNTSLFHYSNIDALDLPVIHRIDLIEEQPLCLSTEQLIRPKSAQTIDKEWMYIIQSGEQNFTQIVRIETCNNEGSKCRLINGFALGYITKCKQKFIYRQLLSISKKGNIVHNTFSFPVSCCCHIQFSPET